MQSSRSSSTPLGIKQTFKRDLMASVVVFLVALPLCMGIAIASGVPPAAGLITGIVGGLVVGFLAGSPLQVSGPAAGLSVVVWMEVERHGIEMLGVIVLIAGLAQLTAGVLRLGQWFRAVSPSVIQGMLAGIGVLIFASQFHVMVDDAPRKGGLENLLSIPGAVWKGLLPSADTNHHWAAAVGVLTILVIVAWGTVVPKKLRFLPAPLVGVVLGTAFAALFSLPIRYVAVPENLVDAITFPTLAQLSRAIEGPILIAGLAMAAVASAETLLCATAVDQLHSGQRTKYDRELAAQGIGNTICGLLGALPMTGVIVRSSANVQAGGTTRLSAILHGAWLLLFVALLPVLLTYIPTASLAAVLVFTGYKLVNPKAVRSLWEYGKSEVAIYAATVAVIVVEDLLTGVLVGIGLSMAKLLYTFSRLRIGVEELPEKKQTVLHLDGAATFIKLPKLAGVLEQVRPSTELRVQFENLNYIDHACLDLLMNWEKQHRSTGGSLVIDWDSLHANFRRQAPRPVPPPNNGVPQLEPVPAASRQPAESFTVH